MIGSAPLGIRELVVLVSTRWTHEVRFQLSRRKIGCDYLVLLISIAAKSTQAFVAALMIAIASLRSRSSHGFSPAFTIFVQHLHVFDMHDEGSYSDVLGPRFRGCRSSGSGVSHIIR
jgi:hypothetical protein